MIMMELIFLSAVGRIYKAMKVAIKATKFLRGSSKTTSKMKLLATVFIAIFLGEGISAQTESNFEEMTETTVPNIEEVIENVEGVADVVDLAASFRTQIIYSKIKIITNGLLERVKKLYEDTKSTVEKMTTLGDSKTKDVAIALQGSVDEIGAKVEHIIGAVNQHFLRGMERINKSNEDSSAKVAEMISEIKEKCDNETMDVPDEDRGNVDEIINEFTDITRGDIPECSREIVAPLLSMYHEAVDVLNSILLDIEGIVENAKKCVEENSDEILECTKETVSNLKNVSQTEELVLSLENEMQFFDINDIIDDSCLNETLDRIQHRKENLAMEIDYIEEKRNFTTSTEMEVEMEADTDEP